MSRLLYAYFVLVGIQYIEFERQAVAATESTTANEEYGQPAVPLFSPSLIEKATQGLSILSREKQNTAKAIVNDADEETQATDAVIWLRMSRDYLANYVERDVDREKPARDWVVGINFVGDSRTTGKTRLVLHPSDDGAIGEVVFEGHVRAKTTGRKGPATLHYLADSKVRAKKRIVIGERGFETRPATAQATTQLTLAGVNTNLPGLVGGIAERIARRRAAASRSQASATVSDHRERDIRKSLDDRLNKRVTEIQSQVTAEIAALKLGGSNEGAAMRSRSTPNFVEVAIYRDGDASRRLQMPQFEVEGNPDIAIRLHRKMLAQIVANGEARARLASLMGQLRGGPSGKESSAQLGTKLAGLFGNEWLSFDIANSTSVEMAERLPIEKGSQTRLR